MKASVLDAAFWTPERGALSAEDGLAALSRFSRACVAVSEWIAVPDANTSVVIGTRSGATAAAQSVGDELGRRWPGAHLRFVGGALETVPVSFLEAFLALRESPRVLWTVVELQPGAELVAAFLLARSTGPGLSLERLPEPDPPPLPHLNPCAGILTLERTTVTESVSIRVGSWLLTREPSP